MPHEPSVILTPDRPPPEDYYQNNCRELFAFTLDRYSDILDPDLVEHVQRYLRASDDAQRLFARILTRKGPNIRTDALRYHEIGCIDDALAELADLGLILLSPTRAADVILKLLKKEELLALVPALDKRMRKGEVLERILGRYPDDYLLRKLRTHYGWLGVARPDVWDLIRLLYFGDETQDWATFVLRDLGVTAYEAVDLDERQFEHAGSLHAYLHYRALSSYSHRLADHPAILPSLLGALAKPAAERFTERRRSRAVLRTAKWLEQQTRLDEALTAYGCVDVHPARERRARILAKLGRAAECEQLLASIERSPVSEEEAQFAERFGKRQAGFQPDTTIVDIAEPPARVEAEALAMLTRTGGWGMHVESSLVRTLTGLVYWSALYAPIPGAFTNPFQIAPHDLYADDFVAVRQPLIDAIEARVADDEAFLATLRSTAHDKRGITNALVNWRLLESVELSDVAEAMPVDHMRRLTHFFIRNLRERRSGLPDLFVAYGENDYELVEVKGPNDQLQPGQRVWLRHLDRLGIPARVLKLRLAS